MRKLSITWMMLMTSAVMFTVSAGSASAAGGPRLCSLNLGSLSKLHLGKLKLPKLGKIGGVDLSSYECGNCGNICADKECVRRCPTTKCVTGQKKVDDCEIHYEYVSIPEVRYRWALKWITKKIPCDGCKPVCKTQDGEHCYGAEKWGKEEGCGTGCGPAASCAAPKSCAAPAGCGECGNGCGPAPNCAAPAGCGECGGGEGDVQCRTIETKCEKSPCKCCEYEPGKTTVKVRYLTCVKEPYTVYRQVKRPVCVRGCHTEDCDVSVTTYRCEKVDSCDNGCDSCGSAGACGTCGK